MAIRPPASILFHVAVFEAFWQTKARTPTRQRNVVKALFASIEERVRDVSSKAIEDWRMYDVGDIVSHNKAYISLCGTDGEVFVKKD